MFLVQAANYVFPLLTIPIVARVFGPEKLGVLNYITAIIGYFILVASYSFNYTGVRRLTRNRNKSREIFSTIFTSQLYLVLICTIVVSIGIFVIKPLKNDAILSCIIFSSCLSILFTQNWFLQAHSDFITIATLSFGYRLTSFILIILFIKEPSDLLLYAAVINVGSLIFSIICFGITLIKYKIKLYISPIKNCICYLKEDRFLFLSSVVTNLYTTSGIVMLGAMSSNQEVGYYASAQKLIDVAKSVMIMPISQIMFPILSEKFGRSKKEGIDAVRSIIPILVLFSFLMLIFMVTFSDVIVRIIFGLEFMSSAPMMVVLSFGLFAVFYGTIIGGQVMLNLGFDKYFLKIQIVVSVLSLVINYIILPNGGGMTTSLVWVGSEFIITIYQIMVLKQYGVVVIDLSCVHPKSIIRSVKYIFKKNGG